MTDSCVSFSARKSDLNRRLQISMVYLPPPFLPSFLFRGECIPLTMLRAGKCEVYEGKYAEYGEIGKDEFLRVQAEAQYVFLDELPFMLRR